MDREIYSTLATGAAETGTAPPATAELLIDLWQRALRLSPIAPDDNFFDLGGDSLQAVGLLLEVERATGVKLPVTLLYDAPTVNRLAAYLDAKRTPRFSPLICLKEGGCQPPFFIVHGLGGAVTDLVELGRLIGCDNPVYAIQAKGLEGKEAPRTRIEGLAESYLQTIRELQPKGPYLLCGYSFGGLIAFEMARQLKQQKEEIGLLVLIDTYPPLEAWPLRARVSQLCRRLHSRCGTLTRQSMRQRASYLAEKWNGMVGWVTQRHDRARPRRAGRRWLPEPAFELPTVLQRLYAANEEALYAYRPRFYPGKITFLKGASSPNSPSLIWRPFAQEFELYVVPGDHRTMVTRHPAGTAEQLSHCLAQIRSAGPAESRSSQPHGSPCHVVE